MSSSDAEEDVFLYVYDISQGMAKMLSPMFLGKQIDGIWHTGIVVYGKEYFFGSDGIQSCNPCGTVLGQPLEKCLMGKTGVPKDVFDEFLRELSEETFRGDKYQLLRHNCNNFSDEVSQFLTGKSIPAHITSLPAEVMATPFGAQLAPIIESAQQRIVSTEGFHYSRLASEEPSDSHGISQQQQQQQRQQQPQPPQESSDTSLPSAARFGPEDASDGPTGFEDPDTFSALVKVGAGSNEESVELLRRLLRHSAGNSTFAGRSSGVLNFVIMMKRLASLGNAAPDKVRELTAKIACNCTQELLCGSGGAFQCLQNFLQSNLPAASAVPALSKESQAAATATGGLMLNLCLAVVSDAERLLDLGLLAVDRLTDAPALADDECQLFLAKALCVCASRSNQVIQLAAVSGVDLAHLTTKSENVRHLQESIQRTRQYQD